MGKTFIVMKRERKGDCGGIIMVQLCLKTRVGVEVWMPLGTKIFWARRDHGKFCWVCA